MHIHICIQHIYVYMHTYIYIYDVVDVAIDKDMMTVLVPVSALMNKTDIGRAYLFNVSTPLSLNPPLDPARKSASLKLRIYNFGI